MDPADETRPSLVMPMDNIPYVSEYEKNVEEKMIRNEKQTKKHTLMTMTLNEIVENTIKTVALFSHEYTKHIYQVSQDHKLRGLQDSFPDRIKTYLLALVNYLGDKDNILYIGILMCFVSIIIYFFNISTS